MRLEGTIAAESDLTISGWFKGKIDAPSHEVVVFDEGVVEADIKAKRVRIQGKVRGDVHSDERAALTSTADIVGTLKTRELRVEEGAVFRGQIDIVT